MQAACLEEKMAEDGAERVVDERVQEWGRGKKTTPLEFHKMHAHAWAPCMTKIVRQRRDVPHNGEGGGGREGREERAREKCEGGPPREK